MAGTILVVSNSVDQVAISSEAEAFDCWDDFVLALVRLNTSAREYEHTGIRADGNTRIREYRHSVLTFTGVRSHGKGQPD